MSSGEEGLDAKRVNGESGLDFEKFSEVGYRNILERQRCKAYADVLRSYEDLRTRLERFEEGKCKILRYAFVFVFFQVAGKEYLFLV